MATQKSKVRSSTEQSSFSIFLKKEIGSVSMSEYGTENPFGLAFAMIGESGEEGNFEFTVPNHVAGKSVTANILVEYGTETPAYGGDEQHTG